jgi:hypothetical protein
MALDRCFLLININDLSGVASSGHSSTYVEIEDAFEGPTWATFMSWFVTKERTNSVITCEISRPGTDNQHCHSRDEWDALTKPYMQD